MQTLAILHTTTVTVDPLKQLAGELIPGCSVINFVDDSILPQLARNGGNLAEVENRLVHYAKFAEEAGADCILNACSSVGALVEKERAAVTIPVIRIDEAMAEQAVRLGSRIGVAATLQTTLKPTVTLLEAKARQAGKRVELSPMLVEEAYRRLLAGDKQGHDDVLASELERLVLLTDLVVLAQASMARVADLLPKEMQGRFVTSPRLGMQKVHEIMTKSTRSES
ncbi:aspartate/glutamate racemase family protein [Paenibacillus gansuensis]|uniref:Aspartate/glutamate racemase family protein n=1 Tax=Paenibacillus gansuensis TaxID=306542 RepID=A0ABW5PAE2_9BACL